MSTEIFKRLGAVAPLATVNTVLYRCPSDTTAVLSGITVANRASAGTFRIAHVDGSIGDLSNADYAYYDTPLDTNSTLEGVLKGQTLGSANTIVVYASSANFSFIVGGIEISGTPLPSYTSVNKPVSTTLTAQECINTLIDNYGQTTTLILTLPVADEGYFFIFSVATVGNDVTLKPASGDQIYLDGVALVVDNIVLLPSPVIGNCVEILSFRTGETTYCWSITSTYGVWIDGGQ